MAVLVIDKGAVVAVLSDDIAESNLSDILSVDSSLKTVQVNGVLEHINRRINRQEDKTHVDEF